MNTVKSSNIEAVGFDPETQRMTVQFKNGNTYDYDNVPQKVHDELVGAESVGRAFNSTIRGKFEGQKRIEED